jgi:hypothetical protein
VKAVSVNRKPPIDFDEGLDTSFSPTDAALFRNWVAAIYCAIDFQRRPEFVQSGGRFGLLGTPWGGPRITDKGDIIVEPAIRMHLGYVIKAKELLALEEEIKRICV